MNVQVEVKLKSGRRCFFVLLLKLRNRCFGIVPVEVVRSVVFVPLLKVWDRIHFAPLEDVKSVYFDDLLGCGVGALCASIDILKSMSFVLLLNCGVGVAPVEVVGSMCVVFLLKLWDRYLFCSC